MMRSLFLTTIHEIEEQRPNCLTSIMGLRFSVCFHFPDIPLVLIDTSGCDMFEVESGDEISKANEGEVALVSHIQIS